MKILADVTAFATDMTTTWMQVEIVINAQNNNDAGANNNVGWNGLGGQNVVRDGQPRTYTWELSDTLTAKIAAADDSIWWFEFALVSNLDGASVTKFYIDNIRLVTPEEAASKGKSTDTIIGNWEQSMDGWGVGGGADARFSDVNGVTLDKYSLDVFVPTGAWASVLTLNLLDPNNAAVREAFRANTKLSADITRLVVDWPVGDLPPWNGIHLIINCGGDGWSLWQDLVYRAGWTQNDGDRTITATWDYSPYLSRIQFDKLTWCALEVVVNANSPNYKGWVWFYIDNMRLFGGGVPLNPQPANAAKDVNVEALLRWTAGAAAKSHHLYLGASSSAVTAARGSSDPSVLFVPLDGTSFDPAFLEFNTQYFWRVDAIDDSNPDSPWIGDVWNFTTGNFLVVDDFEGNLQDSSGNGFHGTFGGNPDFPATYMAGPAGFGQGLLFNGTGGHQNVELGTFNPSAATGHLTVALWARWNGLTNQWQGLIGKRDGWAVDNMLWDIEINRDTGTIQFRRIDSYPNAGGRVLPIGQWTHIAATFNGTTARFYLNGEETGNGNFSFAQKKDAMLHFGSGDPNGGNAFNGALDDIRLYDKALTAAEVKALLTP